MAFFLMMNEMMRNEHDEFEQDDNLTSNSHEVH